MPRSTLATFFAALLLVLVPFVVRGQGGETGGGGGPGGGVGHNLTQIVDDAGCQPNDFVIRDGVDAFFDCRQLVPLAQITDDNVNSGRCLVSGGSGVPSYQICPGGGTADVSTMTDSGGICASGHVVRKNPGGSPVFNCVAATGTGTITAVGPAFTTGPAFTDGVASSGTLMFVWEGTGTDDAFELNIFSPTATPTEDINVTFPSTTGSLVGRGDTGTVTGLMVAADTLTDVDIATGAIKDLELDINTVKGEIEQNISLTNIVTGSLAIGKVSGGSAGMCAQYTSLGVLGSAAAACGSGSTTLDALTDVTLTTPAIGAILKYSGSQWIDGQLDLADGDAITGNLSVTNLGSGTGATNQTFWRGDGQWAAEANSLTTITAGIAADQIPMGTGPDDVTYLAMPTNGTQGCDGSGQALQYNTVTDAFDCITGLATGSGISSVREQDTNPNYTGLSGLIFDQADGFIVSQPGAGEAEVDLSVTTQGITDGAVTYAKIQPVGGNNVFLGRRSGAGGIVEEMNQIQATALINVFTSTLSGATPSSGGGTTNFLRADGTWTAPTGTPAANSVGTIELDEDTDTTPAVNELLRVNSGTASTFEYGPCTMTDAGAITCADDLRSDTSLILGEESTPAAPPANTLKLHVRPWDHLTNEPELRLLEETGGAFNRVPVLNDNVTVIEAAGTGDRTAVFAANSGRLSIPTVVNDDVVPPDDCSAAAEVGNVRFRSGNLVASGKGSLCVCAQEGASFAWRCYDQSNTVGGTETCLELRAADITCNIDDQLNVPGNDGCSGVTVSGTGHSFHAATFASDYVQPEATKSGSWNFTVPASWGAASLKVVIDWIGDSANCDGVASDGPDPGSTVETDNVCFSVKTASLPGTASESFIAPTFGAAIYQQATCSSPSNMMRMTIDPFTTHGLAAGERGILTLTRVISDLVEGTGNGCTNEDQYFDPAKVVGVRLCTN